MLDTTTDGTGGIESFLIRIRSGDEDAARDLLKRYEAEVRLVVRRQLPRLLRSRFDSIDFLQSVWADFFQKVRSGQSGFEDERHLVGFLARAAKNKVIDQYRRAASQKQNVYREEPIWTQAGRTRELAGQDATPSQVAEAREALGRLQELMPDDRRMILELKAQGLSSREIGERLGVSERTIQREIEDLRRRMQSEWGEPGDW